MRALVICAVLLGSQCLGQVSVDEANRRLTAKQSDPTALRAELDQRTRDVAALRKLGADLQSRLDHLTARYDALAATTRPASVAATRPTRLYDAQHPENSLSLGMTIAQANQALGREGTLMSQDPESAQLRWDFFGPAPIPRATAEDSRGITGVDAAFAGANPTGRQRLPLFSVFGTFRNGKLESFHRS